MYSKNDYRYYLEDKLIHSDDFLAHYGIKGMKWKQHIKKQFDNRYDTYSIKGRHKSDGGYDFKEVGIESKRNPNKYFSVGKKKYDNGRKSIDFYAGPSKKERSISKGRISIDTGSEGSHVGIDTTKRKKKSKRKPFDINSLKRTKPKGKKLKGGGNIYVSHK